MSKALKACLKALGLVVVSFVALAVAGVVSGVARPAASAAPPSQAASASPLPSLLLLCVLVAGVFSWAICRSRLRGWRLVLAVYAAHLGLGTVMPQMESALFLPRHLPPGFVGQMMVMGAINAAIFAPIAVWIWGRLGEASVAATQPLPSLLSDRRWPLRMAGLAATYVAIYLAAGYFIAFRNPDVLAYYGATDPGSFAGQVQRIWEHTPWFFALQFLRGGLWIGFALPLLLAFQGARLERALLIGCLYSMWIVMLLAPNPYMPESVRLSHLIETLPSNFVFGGLVGWWLGPLTR